MRLSFLGVSHWHSTMHAEAALAAGATVQTAWDPDAAAAAAFADRFSCTMSSSLENALEGADFAVVMGRPSEIADRGLAVTEAGVPLLIEKPIGISAAASDLLIASAERNKAFVAVALPHGLGMMAAVRNLAKAERLGTISHSHFRLINGPPQRYVNDGVPWVLDRGVGGGGALRNLGIHGVSAFLTLAGAQPVEIVSISFGRPLHETEVEDYAVVVLRAPDGMIGIVEAGYTFPSMSRGLFEWRVSAKNASLIDAGDRLTVTTLDDGSEQILPITLPAHRYNDVLADTLKRFSHDLPPATSLADCRRAMEIIDHCYALKGN
ncbi:Gfo/Idh/MocA family protein [Brucella cytisi]|uniref:Oxidoreductase n=1 Tax=Brucella cytisi TaxID=407152 RepID=A0A1J6HGW8_9HYPH|nr:Gfo/Idh/MocA family oxidoreductase [Brucella cytisi]OIS91627.1 oxidoreductase [Brucella cytisi]